MPDRLIVHLRSCAPKHGASPSQTTNKMGNTQSVKKGNSGFDNTFNNKSSGRQPGQRPRMVYLLFRLFIASLPVYYIVILDCVEGNLVLCL